MKNRSYKEKAEELDRIPIEEIIKSGKHIKRVTTTPKEKRSGILSIRMEPETLRGLEIFARGIGEKPSTIARDFVRQGLSSNGVLLSIDELVKMLRLRIEMEAETIAPLARETYIRVKADYEDDVELHLDESIVFEEHKREGGLEANVRQTGGESYGSLAPVM